MFWPFCCIPSRATSKPKNELNRTLSIGTQTSIHYSVDGKKLTSRDQKLYRSISEVQEEEIRKSRHKINAKILDPVQEPP
jgi:hypothetical protein